jgi:hypothetical protein
MARSEPVRTALAAVLVGVVVTSVSWWRLGPVAARTVWAEDGGVFLREHLDEPWDLLRPYAGYLHLVPRVVVGAAWALPVEHYAVALSLGSCLVVGGAAALVTALARDVVGPWPVRFLLAAVPAVLPLAPHEIAGNAANLHWFLLALAPWLLAYRPRSWWATTGLASVTLAVVLSEPLTVLFLPLLLLGWSPTRRRAGRARHRAHSVPRSDLRPLPVTLAAVLGATAQVVVASTAERRDAATTPPHVVDVVAGWLLQPLGGLLRPRVGDVVRAVLDNGWWVLVVPALAVAALLAAAVVVGPARGRCLVLAFAGGSVATWTAALWANGVGVPWATPTEALVGVLPLRYAAASGLLLLSAIATAGGVLVTARGVRVARSARPGFRVDGTGAVARRAGSCGPVRSGPVRCGPVRCGPVRCGREARLRSSPPPSAGARSRSSSRPPPPGPRRRWSRTSRR